MIRQPDSMTLIGMRDDWEPYGCLCIELDTERKVARLLAKWVAMGGPPSSIVPVEIQTVEDILDGARKEVLAIETRRTEGEVAKEALRNQEHGVQPSS